MENLKIRKFIFLVLVVALIMLGVLAMNHYKRSSDGFCKAANKNFTDEDYIRLALSSFKWESFKKEDTNFDYLKHDPDCCILFREKDYKDRIVRDFNSWYWHEAVIVKVFYEDIEQFIGKNKSGNPEYRHGSAKYFLIENCLKGIDEVYDDGPSG